METNEKTEENLFSDWEKDQRRGRVCAGLLVIAASVLYFLRENGTLIPQWVFSWPMIFVGIGIITAVKHRFRGGAWMIFLFVGVIFLAESIFPDITFGRYKIPLILLMVGLILIFKPARKHRHFRHFQHHKRNFAASTELGDSDEDFLKVDNLFAGTKKNLISKQLKGGEIRNTFGGCEINLMQADFSESLTLNINQQLGGLKLIIPSSWNVKSELVCVFGGIEDHRATGNSELKTKTLYLKGQVVMGGVEIVSY